MNITEKFAVPEQGVILASTRRASVNSARPESDSGLLSVARMTFLKFNTLNFR